MNPLQQHPNATVALISGSGIGSAIAWALGRYGIHPSAEELTALAGGVSAVVLFVGRNGIVGTWQAAKRLVLHGTSGTRPAPRKPKAGK